MSPFIIVPRRRAGAPPAGSVPTEVQAWRSFTGTASPINFLAGVTTGNMLLFLWVNAALRRVTGLSGCSDNWAQVAEETGSAIQIQLWAGTARAGSETAVTVIDDAGTINLVRRGLWELSPCTVESFDTDQNDVATMAMVHAATGVTSTVCLAAAFGMWHNTGHTRTLTAGWTDIWGYSATAEPYVVESLAAPGGVSAEQAAITTNTNRRWGGILTALVGP